MTEQPEALRLADVLENKLGGAADEDIEKAAAELRRLHQSECEGWRYANELEQERTRLHSVNAQLLEALEWVARRCPERFIEEVLHPGHREAAYDAGACARAAIATAKELK